MTKKHTGNKGIHDKELTNIGVMNKSDDISYECDVCGKKHKEYEDVYEWYGHYLDFNPKNTDVEIWDIEKKVWKQRGY
jgi:hypothetical protein